MLPYTYYSYTSQYNEIAYNNQTIRLKNIYVSIYINDLIYMTQFLI